MPAPALGSPGGFAAKLNVVGLVKDFVGSFVDLTPLQSWFQDTVEKVVPGGQGVYATYQLQARADFMVRMVTLLLQAEGTVQPQLTKLAALGIEDLFGVPVNPAALAGRGAAGLRGGAIAPLADAVTRGMFSALGSTGEITPQAGYNSMLKLLENQLLFAVEGWLEGNLGLGLFAGELPGIGDLDDIVSRTLGLGRITARAMRPLIDATILEPARQHLNKTYLSELPSESLAVRMLYRDVIDETEFFDIMARRGWSRARAAEFKLVHAQLPGRSDLRALLELGRIGAAGVKDYLLAQGFPPAVADDLVVVIQEDRTRTLRGNLATLARDMYRDREIEDGEFRQLTLRAGYSQDETELLLALAQLERSRPRRLAQGTIEDMYRRDVVDIDELHGYYRLQGFADVDVFRLETLAVAEKVEYEARVAARKVRPPPESPGAVPRGVALEAHRRGLLTDQVLREVLAGQGFEGLALETQLRVAAERRKEFVDAKARQLPPPRGLSTSQGTAEEAFVRGLVGDQELLALYAERGFTGRALDVLIALRRAERAEWIARQLAQAAAAAGATSNPLA
jgi:hypothetical protein